MNRKRERERGRRGTRESSNDQVEEIPESGRVNRRIKIKAGKLNGESCM